MRYTRTSLGPPDRPPHPGRWWSLLMPVVALALLCFQAGVRAQEAEEEVEGDEALPKVVVPLLERERFDQITLDAENENAVIEVEPLENIPVNPPLTQRLRIRLLVDPERQYDVLFQHIAKIRTYDQLVYDEAQKLIREKKYDEAFPYLDYLLRNTTTTAGLRSAILDYLYDNAGQLFDEGKYEHALAVMEELSHRDPNYKRADVAQGIARIADALIKASVEVGDYRNARGLMARLSQEYPGGRIRSVEQWRRQLIRDATELKDQAGRLVAEGKLRDAERVSRRMNAIWPELAGAKELNEKIAGEYPMVIVGVAEVSGAPNPTAMDNWSARRTGHLCQRTLLEFLGAGPEGGQYSCPLGSYEQSDDRRGLTIDLNPAAVTGSGSHVNGYDVSRQLLMMTDPRSPFYQPAWASLMVGAQVNDVFQVDIALRRPHVLPEAMLQVPLMGAPGAAVGSRPSDGPYLPKADDDGDTHFLVNPQFTFAGESHPSEVVERYFKSSQDALTALMRGDIDIVDYLFPADAAMLRGSDRFTVEPYALPTIHALVPVSDNPWLTSQTFRRALVYGINRQVILSSELLGNRTLPGCQVISGPFPPGIRDNDPLAYAYDERISARSWYPRLASILVTLARRELKEIAAKRDEEFTEDTKLVLGYPGNEVARVACQSIAQYLQPLGIEIELLELPQGMSVDPEGRADLLYLQVAMWEPVIDARRLLAPAGVTSIGNEYVGMALRRLDAAKNWREAR
jgi:tetratricopeptide (TPR) repeat protein